MSEPQRPQPQLVLVRRGLGDLPPVVLPAGYALTCFRPGDEAAWSAIITESFQRADKPFDFERTMRADPVYRPERVLFVTDSTGRAVATASAWRQPDRFPGGVVHYVGVLDGHRGRRLGYWVSLAAMHRIRDEGLDEAFLQTDDFRLPAVRTYLNLGFAPLLVDENQRARWAAVFAALGAPELCERFAVELSGPIWRMPTPTRAGPDPGRTG